MNPVNILQADADLVTTILGRCEPPYYTDGPGWGAITIEALGKFADAAEAGNVHTYATLVTAAPLVVTTPSGSLADAIIGEANRFAGLHEIRANAAWAGTTPDDLDVAAELKADLIKYSGWEPGEAYCAAFGKMILALAYGKVGRASDFLALNSLLNLSVVASANNLRAKGLLTQAFAPGCLIFFAHGNTGSGHMAIGRFKDGSVIHTTEANTSASDLDSGSAQYEGDGIYQKTRTIVDGTANGMRLLGYFVHA